MPCLEVELPEYLIVLGSDQNGEFRTQEYIISDVKILCFDLYFCRIRAALVAQGRRRVKDK